MADIYEFRILKEEAEIVVRDCVVRVLDGKAYNSSKVGEWNKAVGEIVLKSLLNLSQNFKYVINCIIYQKNGAGMDVSTSCFWDSRTDAGCSVVWENKTIYCAVTVFGLAL